MKMVDVRMTMDEYLTLLGGIPMDSAPELPADNQDQPRKKRSTAYSRRYKAAFKKIQKRYKLKNGKWKKNGFKAAVKEAHKMAKKGKGKK